MIKIGTYKYQYNWNFFEQESEELFYFLGFVAADGYLSDNEIEIGVNEKDVSLLERFRDLIVPGKKLYHKVKTNSYTLKISCRSKMQDFKAFYSMQTNNKCYEVKFPGIPDQYVKDFIRGYVDGDGCIDTAKAYRGDKVYIGPRLRILGNYTFLSELNAATKKFCEHKVNAVSKKGKENIYYLNYNFKTARALLTWLYDGCTICLDRKKDRAQLVTGTEMQ